ncbi:unnamed protein product, partial [marine sediment metagenome]
IIRLSSEYRAKDKEVENLSSHVSSSNLIYVLLIGLGEGGHTHYPLG